MRLAHFGGAAQQADAFCEVDIDALSVYVVAAERIEAPGHAGIGQIAFVGQVFSLGD